jgi:hypothetical protein
MDITRKVKEKLGQLGHIEARLMRVQEALARVENRQLAALAAPGLQAYEFRAFSQWGEDGIIQHLVRALSLPRGVFVEFGVETYVESNTRFLLVNDNWAGLVIDGSAENIAFIKNDPIYWRHNLKAECSFITAENINELISRNGIRGEIGILSVDIDGNDYWVWKAIDVVEPVIVIVEYNARFGPSAAVTVPYDAAFVRGKAHHSMIYYGASLAAFCKLGAAKGYALVGCNSAGNNAFFVRRDRLPAGLPTCTPEQAYVRNQFRESRNAAGELSFIDPEAEHTVLAGLPLVKVD